MDSRLGDRPFYAFGEFRLDANRRVIEAFAANRRLLLPPRIFDAALYFVRHPGLLLSKERLLAELWPGMVVEENTVLTGLMVAGRAGASMAAELGTMRVTEQIDALHTMATNPMKYLVVPRFLASTIMMFFLSALGMYIGILGGYFVGVKVLGTNPVTYINQSINNTEVSDIWYGLIKSMVFGAVVGLIGCYKGFNTEGGAEGVGKATTGAVVVSCMLILILDYFLSPLLW